MKNRDGAMVGFKIDFPYDDDLIHEFLEVARRHNLIYSVSRATPDALVEAAVWAPSQKALDRFKEDLMS